MTVPQRPVRVRFAPSPTGYLHVGGARTAIYNYFFAKAMGGTFYLRIEDTDRKRYNEQALHDLLRDLKWLGLQWDEGPEVDGPYGPYAQSERLDLYHDEVKRLVDGGLAYPCFCSEERLEQLRKDQEASGGSQGYDRQCRDLDEAEVKRRILAGEKWVVRFKVPLQGVTVFEDLVRGRIEMQNALQDDLVLIKRDGYPTYHLASVVDDHHMQTSHVLRGDEWISSTPKHVLLYQAFKWDPPVFCHLPVILAAGGGKLSKRKGAASVGDFRDLGYLPEALVNFLALLGWSAGDDREVMSIDEMIAAFTLERIHPKAVAFDEKKLEWMNGQHIHRTDDAWLVQWLQPKLQEQFGSDHAAIAKLPVIVAMLKTRVHFLSELPEMARTFFEAPTSYEEKAVAKHWVEPAAQTVATILDRIKQLPAFDASVLERLFADLSNDLHLKLGQLIHPTRLAVSGTSAGPGLFELLATLGKQETISRLERALPLMK